MMDPIRNHPLESQDYINILHVIFCKNLNFPSKAMTPIYSGRKIKNNWVGFFREWVLFKVHFLISKGHDSCFLARLDVTVLLGSTLTRVWQLENPSSYKTQTSLNRCLLPL